MIEAYECMPSRRSTSLLMYFIIFCQVISSTVAVFQKIYSSFDPDEKSQQARHNRSVRLSATYISRIVKE